jgi:hypothetical protein
MNALQRLRNADDFNVLYLDHLVEKANVSQRRKTKFKPNGDTNRGEHWANHTGTYRDEEIMKGPKYWRGQKPVKGNNPIQSYPDLSTAIQLIAAGEKNYNNFRGVSSGINDCRLRLAQSWRDKGIGYDVSDIMRLSIDRINQELGFGRVRYGKVYHN